jgi:hypothetical protein
MGNVALGEALDLVILYAEVEPAKFEKAAVRWLGRYVAESKPSLLRVQMAVAALSELRGGSDAAKKILAELAGSPQDKQSSSA